MAQALYHQSLGLPNGPGLGLTPTGPKGRQALYENTVARFLDLTANLDQDLVLNHTRGVAVGVGLVNEGIIETGKRDPTTIIEVTDPTIIIVVITIIITEVVRISKTEIDTTTTIRTSATIIEEASSMGTIITIIRTIAVEVRIVAEDSSIITGRDSVILEITEGISGTDVPTHVIGTVREVCHLVR